MALDQNVLFQYEYECLAAFKIAKLRHEIAYLHYYYQDLNFQNLKNATNTNWALVYSDFKTELEKEKLYSKEEILHVLKRSIRKVCEWSKDEQNYDIYPAGGTKNHIGGSKHEVARNPSTNGARNASIHVQHSLHECATFESQHRPSADIYENASHLPLDTSQDLTVAARHVKSNAKHCTKLNDYENCLYQDRCSTSGVPHSKDHQDPPSSMDSSKSQEMHQNIDDVALHKNEATQSKMHKHAAVGPSIIDAYCKGSGRQAHVEYVLEYRTLKMEKIVLCRRYSDFMWLSRQLYNANADSQYCIPTLPSKESYRNKSRFRDAFVCRRREFLQYWIQFVVGHSMLSYLHPLQVFLRASKQQWGAFMNGTLALENTLKMQHSSLIQYPQIKIHRYASILAKVRNESAKNRATIGGLQKSAKRLELIMKQQGSELNSLQISFGKLVDYQSDESTSTTYNSILQGLRSTADTTLRNIQNTTENWECLLEFYATHTLPSITKEAGSRKYAKSKSIEKIVYAWQEVIRMQNSMLLLSAKDYATKNAHCFLHSRNQWLNALHCQASCTFGTSNTVGKLSLDIKTPLDEPPTTSKGSPIEGTVENPQWDQYINNQRRQNRKRLQSKSMNAQEISKILDPFDQPKPQRPMPQHGNSLKRTTYTTQYTNYQPQAPSDEIVNETSPVETINSNWVQTSTQSGQVYYYHKITRASRWTKPSENLVGTIEQRIFQQQLEVDQRIAQRQEERFEQYQEECQHAEYVEKIRQSIEDKVRIWAWGKPLRQLINTAHEIVHFVPEYSALSNASTSTEVRKRYMQIVRLIHPDKIQLSSNDAADRVLCQTVFTVIASAYDAKRD